MDTFHLADLSDAIAKSREDWLSELAARHLPSEVYLRAFGNDACKQDVAHHLQAHGFVRRIYPDREELWRGDEWLGTWQSLLLQPPLPPGRAKSP